MWLQVPSVALALLAATTSASNPLDQQTNQHRGLEAEGFGFSSYKSCECKSGRRQCLFIHGELHAEQSEDLETKSNYFGNMEDHAPCCSSIEYVSLDTMNKAWTSKKLQKKVCHHALSMSDTSDMEEKVIRNTILVTHSMGALILAGAIANKTCSLEQNTTSWVSMSAPMLGTMASDTAQDDCSKENWEPFRDFLSLVGQCPVGKGMKSLAYIDGEHATKKLTAAYERAQEAYRRHVTAAMCSDGYQGIFSVHQAKYIWLGGYIKHVAESDGLVTYKSCRGGLSEDKFSSDPTDPFYVTTCNHADTAFRHGNDPFMDSMKPVRWFECLF